jgi:hypothetical protein
MKKSIITILSLVLMLSGCAAAAPVSNSVSVAPSAPPMAAPAMDSAAQSKQMAGAAPAPEFAAPMAPGEAAAPDQLVIQNANLSIVVSDPVKAQDAIEKLTKDVQGYVVSSNLYKSQSEAGVEYPEVNISIRVPAEKLDDVLNRIKGLVQNPQLDVLSETRSGQNVTKEYTDLKSRLTNLEQAEAQLREIMASATRTEDVLAVFNQLTSIREQIEVIKGQMKYYEESAAMSAVDVRIQSQESVAPLTVGSWQPEGVARDAVQALINALKFLVTLLIWVVAFVLPIGVVLFLIIGLPIILIRRSRAKRKAANTPPPSA